MKKYKKLVFIGDSVTAANRTISRPNGRGYVEKIEAQMPTFWDVVNKGVNGNRLADLDQRWEGDVLRLYPDAVSINIGVNDSWKRFFGPDPTPHNKFRVLYTRLIIETLAFSPDMKIILREPFILPVSKKKQEDRRDLERKIETVHHLANEFSILVVPFDTHLNLLMETVKPSLISKDGIHPTNFANNEMARLWIDTCLQYLSPEN